MYEEKGKNRRKVYVWWFIYCADMFRLQGFVCIQKYFIKIVFLVWEITITDKFFDSVGPDEGFQLNQKSVIIIIFTNPSARAGYDTKSIFKRSLTGLNSEFSFSKTSCLTKAEEHSPPYYLPIAGGRIFGFIPFPRVLVLCEMQSVLSRIWTCVAVSISYADNHYTTGTSIMYLL